MTPNGCGGTWSWFKPPYAVFFETDCNEHDRLYEKWWDYIERKIADVYLLEYMKRDIKKLSFYKRPYFYIWAYIYYVWVRVGWAKYFNFK